MAFARSAGGRKSEDTRMVNTLKYVFGPVPSRRLGRSLGIDPVPLKACNWNCVYCQLGRTVPVTNERKDFIPPDIILSEIREALGRQERNTVDWITFAGSGEPLLHASIGRLVAGVKSMTDIPVALLTNGSFLHLSDVRDAALPVDAVLPSIDAGSADVFRKINRPHPGVSYEQHIGGLVAFREAYKGKFWPEVMLVRGLNDTEKALSDIARVLERLRPDLVHINVPTRPPSETWVGPPDDEGLMRAVGILGRSVLVVVPGELEFDAGPFDSVVEALIGIVSRHPVREEEIRRMLRRWPAIDVSRALAEVAASGRVQFIERFGIRFWSAAGSRYSRDDREKTR
jgi:wyosine [tRNA(Phe)-imidazoG37] synthetase (radical SAM superfamily)